MKQLPGKRLQASPTVSERARLVNRIEKILEEANIKLASVASDVVGKSGQAMLRASIAGEEDTSVMAELAAEDHFSTRSAQKTE